MYKKVFIDANVFIDSNDDSRKSYKESFKIIPFLLKNNIAIYTSCDLITTIYYVLSKKSKQKALDNIEELNKICKVIEFSNKEVSQTCALMRENKKFKDLEDTLQYVLAQKSGCEIILSNDKNFYAQNIELMNTTSFYEKYVK